MTLQELGFDQWFAAHCPHPLPEGLTPARVVAVDRGRLLLGDGHNTIPAAMAGRLGFTAQGPGELPCVGDWVLARRHSGGGAALVEGLLPRRSFLRRKTPGAGCGQQFIAANLDAALIVQSCHFDFNPSRLERYLVMAADGGVTPAVVLTKADLVPPVALERMLELARSLAAAQVLAVSCVTGQGMEGLEALLLPGRTYCLLGSSGVGKTTLANRLLGREAFATRAVSGTGEGVHTTTRRHLCTLAGGALLIDTPGMRELGVLADEDGVEAGFGDIAALAARCRFADCRHDGEPGCAVAAALEAGELAAGRFANFLKLRRESEFHALTQEQRRRKDRAFGRLVSQVKKRRFD